mmetsp:Transcript_61103/g.150342  ORF Transcript_61103/g.150342 Transcript_61103/m.150342 type:complete len:403 (-) Transcript_61103:169-1377(-)
MFILQQFGTKLTLSCEERPQPPSVLSLILLACIAWPGKTSKLMQRCPRMQSRYTACHTHKNLKHTLCQRRRLVGRRIAPHKIVGRDDQRALPPVEGVEYRQLSQHKRGSAREGVTLLLQDGAVNARPDLSGGVLQDGIRRVIVVADDLDKHPQQRHLGLALGRQDRRHGSAAPTLPSVIHGSCVHVPEQLAPGFVLEVRIARPSMVLLAPQREIWDRRGVQRSRDLGPRVEHPPVRAGRGEPRGSRDGRPALPACPRRPSVPRVRVRGRPVVPAGEDRVVLRGNGLRLRGVHVPVLAPDDAHQLRRRPLAHAGRQVVRALDGAGGTPRAAKDIVPKAPEAREALPALLLLPPLRLPGAPRLRATPPAAALVPALVVVLPLKGPPPPLPALVLAAVPGAGHSP